MSSLNSSMAREVLMASRVSVARLASQNSFFSKSMFSSSCNTLSIFSTAVMTSLKWLLPARAAREASTESRASWPSFAANLSTSTELLVRLEEVSCKKRKPCEAKDFFKRSRASSLWRISMVFEIAARSPVRSTCLSFHSCFFSARDFCTCSMYFLSFSICSVSESNSSCDSSLDKPLAPFSFSIFSKASSVAVFSAPLDSINLSKRATAASSFSFASVRSLVKSCKCFASKSWILKERAL
mmetsp:Transcript_105150/g.302336  ORF Transcript_105150/g.302336 Transcript_105150/m.302336 type:complete len:241 (+) Transcript_105150:907-1629(+)